MSAAKLDPAVLAVPGPIREQLRHIVRTLLANDIAPSVNKVQEVAQVRRSRVSVVVRACRAGLLDPEVSWLELPDGAAASSDAQRTSSADDLSLMLRVARTDEDRAHIQHEMAARLASGELDLGLAKGIRDMMAGARQSARAHRDAVGDEEAGGSVLLCSEKGLRLVRTFDRIVSEERRDAALLAVLEQAKADVLETPSVDTGGL